MSDEDLRIDSKQATKKIAAPPLHYLPRIPKGPLPGIALVGCGGISSYHLEAYRAVDLPVLALCDLEPERAVERRDEFYPDAEVVEDYEALVGREDISVWDVATHPEPRMPIIESALRAGKHVLSQKPFVSDLAVGDHLVELADKSDVRLAVNQNGRWAPHFSYMAEAVRTGHVGDVTSVRFQVNWDHTWTKGTQFDEIPHLVLYDFGIHWFDMATQFMGSSIPRQVYASTGRAAGQTNKAPLLAQVMIEYDDAQVSISFDASSSFGPRDTTHISGTKGSLHSEGVDLNHQRVTLSSKDGVATPDLKGEWFKNGFLGTMMELLCSIDEGRQPSNSARSTIQGLRLCHAAMASADSGNSVDPNSIQ